MERSRLGGGGWWRTVGLCALVLGTAGPALGEPTVPNTFTGGTTISAQQVNQNFSALAAAIPSANYLHNYNNGTLPNGTALGSGTIVDLVGMTLTPPADGVLIVTVGVLVTIAQTAAGRDGVLIGVDRVEGGGSGNGRLALDSTGGHAQTLVGTPTDTWAFRVTGGETTTLKVYAMKWYGTNPASYNEPWMTVLFVPSVLPCTANVPASSGNYGCYP